MLHEAMKRMMALAGMAVLLTLMSSCANRPEIKRVREVPLNDTGSPSFETGLHRAQTTYLMRGALTAREREARLGQYYFVTWHDAEPGKGAELVMSYQQSATGSKVLHKKIGYQPGRSSGTRKDIFRFIGDEHVALGDVLAWRIDLKVGDKVASTKKSFLWRDDYTTSR